MKKKIIEEQIAELSARVKELENLISGWQHTDVVFPRYWKPSKPDNNLPRYVLTSELDRTRLQRYPYLDPHHT